MTRLPDAIKGRIAAKPLLTMVEIPEMADCNPYGWKEIHIYAFNVDGRGLALVSTDDNLELGRFDINDLLIILNGDLEDGRRLYRPKGRALASASRENKLEST